jgi:hypothetical protein
MSPKIFISLFIAVRRYLSSFPLWLLRLFYLVCLKHTHSHTKTYLTLLCCRRKNEMSETNANNKRNGRAEWDEEEDKMIFL